MSDPTMEEFEERALQFLRANASPREPTTSGTWGIGPDRVALFEDRGAQSELEAARAWRRLKFDAGYGWIKGPLALGGGGLPRSYEVVWNRLESRFAVPSGRKYFTAGLEIVAPAVLRYGREALSAEVLPPLFRGDVVACQLFSEPGAGSDLAGLSMSAQRDGDGWRLRGQKVWTSVAHLSDWGLVICRSDPEKEKHQGLTAFLVDMASDRVTVRPLRQMTGGASFNEVFIDNAWVADDRRVGREGDGWAVATSALFNERATIGASGGGGAGGGLTSVEGLAQLIRFHGKAGDPLIRQQYAEICTLFNVIRYTAERLAGVGHSANPGPELSIVKLLVTRRLQLVSDLVAACLGPKMIADGGEWGTYSWSQFVLGVPGLRIAGGTDEILKNILAERVLGLPKESSGLNR